MGVHGLWELLAPVGRRVSVELLGNRKLAIDASIWIIQFMKAMRDERGDMIRNAHLLGFFRRICKLLFLRAKPVFVFDGGTPALKRRTVIARRRQRENAQSRIRKTAEKLLLNHLRTRTLDEMAHNIGLSQLDMNQKQRKQKNVSFADDKLKGIPEDSSSVRSSEAGYDIAESSNVVGYYANESADAVLAASLAAELEGPDHCREAASVHSDSDGEEEQFILPSTQGQLDTAVLASLPPSMQLDLLVQMREQQVAHNRQKFQKLAEEPASFSQLQIQAYLKTVAFRREISKVQKSVVGGGGGGVPSSRIASEIDREFIFSSSFHGKKQHVFLGGLNFEEDKRDAMEKNSNQSPGLISNFVESEKDDSHYHRRRDLMKQASYEISFHDDGRKPLEDEDINVFEALVKGDAIADSLSFQVDETEKRTHVCTNENEADMGEDDEECIWEDADMKHNDMEVTNVDNHVLPPWEQNVEEMIPYQGFHPENARGGEVEWEDRIGSGVPISPGVGDVVAPGVMDIEAIQIEEAIRRSLEDFGPRVSLKGTSEIMIKEPHVKEKKEAEENFSVYRSHSENLENAVMKEGKASKGKAVVETFPIKNILGAKAKSRRNEEWCVGHSELESLVSKKSLDSRDPSVAKVAGNVVNEKHNQASYEISFCNDVSRGLDDTDRYLFEALVKGEDVPDSFSFQVDESKKRIDVCTNENEVDVVNEDDDECIWEDSDRKHDDIDTTNVDNYALFPQGENVETMISHQGFQLDNAGGNEMECKDGKEVGVSIGEVVTPSLIDIEALQLEEAIHRSLKDFSPAVPFEGASQFMIKELGTEEINGTDKSFSVYGSHNENPEDTVLKEQWTRKVKAVPDAYSADDLLMEETKDARNADWSTGILDLKSCVPSGDSCASEVVVEAEKEKHNFDVNLKGVKMHMEYDNTPQLCVKNPQTSSALLESLDESLNGQSQSPSEAGTLKDTISQFELHQHPVKNENISSMTNLHLEETPSRKLLLTVDKKNQVATISKLHENNLNIGAEDALIRDAEDINISQEVKAFSEREAEFLAEREELTRKAEELQVELDAEQELQARLQEDREMLLREESELQDAQRRNERNAESVTGEMFSECQELLQMFGLPFIIAPMEAEAQCAYMDAAQLVDGVVTDDSDVFLFGGRNVYKNIFDDRKYVETYYLQDIETELGLNREKLIHMALLLGSDYTEGISGIGIVNAIEVVNAFPTEDGLKKFKDWIDSPDVSLLGGMRPKILKKSPKTSRKHATHQTEKNANGNDLEAPVTETQMEVGDLNDTMEEEIKSGEHVLQQFFMEKHRTVSKNWNVPDSFPNATVISAYKFPQVDKSTEPFSWGRPDLEALRRLCFDKFGWNKERADELLLPVLKEYDRHETQLRLDAFYSFNQRFAKIRSKRIQKAVTQITGGKLTGSGNPPPHISPPPTKKHKGRKGSHSHQMIAEEKLVLDTDDGQRQSDSDGALHSSIVKKHILTSRNVGKDMSAQVRRGKGGISERRKEIERLKVRGSGKHKMKRAPSEGSSKQTDSEEETDELEGAKLEGWLSTEQQLPRRSTRSRQKATYRFADSEDDDDSSLCINKVHDEAMLGVDKCSASPPLEAAAVTVEAAVQLAKIDLVKGIDQMDTVLVGQEEGTEHTTSVPGSTDFPEHLLPADQPVLDYLATGGGFCLSEKQEEGYIDVPAENSIRQEHVSEILGPGADAGAILPSAAQTPLDVSCLGLRAVPSLKRKKRPSTSH